MSPSSSPASALTGATAQGDLAVFETPVLRSIDQRQRLVLVHRKETLVASALVIEFDNLNSAESTAQLFERVRKQLVDRYGNPDAFLEEGQFGPNLASDLDGGRFIRTMQWQTPSGVIRFGVPRRFDGQVRMEIRTASAPRPCATPAGAWKPSASRRGDAAPVDQNSRGGPALKRSSP